MRFEMKMPDLATTESQIRVVRWLIEPGQTIERGAVLLEIETDKATMEVESVVDGLLADVQAQAGAEVSAGQVIAVFEVVDDARPADAAARTDNQVPIPPPPQHAERAIEGSPAPSATTPRVGESDVDVSTDSHLPIPPPPQRAKRAIEVEGSSPENVHGSSLPDQNDPPSTPSVTPTAGGPPVGMFARNRAAAAAGRVAGAIPLSVAQRVAGKRLQESKQTIPHFYLQTSFDASAIVAHREAAGPIKPAWDAFFVLAVAKAIARFDRFRCRFDSERLTPIESDAIGVAVDIDGDLYTVPIPGAAAKTVAQISADIRAGAERLRNGDPEMRKLHPARMTVTNLGACNVESFLPIINPPEAAILGVGKVMPTAVVGADGKIGAQSRCTLTLCVDHRIASGTYAGDFLGAIIKELERDAEAM